MAGCGRRASTYIKKVHPTFVGQSPSGVISFHNCNSIRNEIIVVECCCILIIYYCWQASSASLLSRARRMTSFVKNSCFVYVIGLAPQTGSFVVGSFFHIWTLLFDAPARCLSVGWSWRAGRMTSFFKNSPISSEVYRLL